MYKILYLLLILIALTNCSTKKVVKHHGVSSLEKKAINLIINESNTNDVYKALGFPSTTSKFDNSLWIYLERKQTQSSILNLGKFEIFENNVLVLEIDNYGILKKKDLYNVEDMKNIKISKETTSTTYTKNSFIYDFMSSLRQKINDPLGKRVKNKEIISQR